MIPWALSFERTFSHKCVISSHSWGHTNLMAHKVKPDLGLYISDLNGIIFVPCHELINFCQTFSLEAFHQFNLLLLAETSMPHLGIIALISKHMRSKVEMCRLHEIGRIGDGRLLHLWQRRCRHLLLLVRSSWVPSIWKPMRLSKVWWEIAETTVRLHARRTSKYRAWTEWWLRMEVVAIVQIADWFWHLVENITKLRRWWLELLLRVCKWACGRAGVLRGWWWVGIC